jgi:hypothetical protein
VWYEGGRFGFGAPFENTDELVCSGGSRVDCVGGWEWKSKWKNDSFGVMAGIRVERAVVGRL